MWKIRHLRAIYHFLQIPSASLFLVEVVLNWKFPEYFETNILLSFSSKVWGIQWEKGSALWGCRYLSALFKLLWGIFITLFFLSSHLCFTYKSWYFGLAHKQHEALIFPAYCKPDFSPASIIRKGTADVKPHQKVWSSYKSIWVSCQSPCSSVRFVFGPLCFSPWLMTASAHFTIFFLMVVALANRRFVVVAEEKRALHSFCRISHFYWCQPRTEVMTNCLCSTLPSSAQFGF